MRQIWIVTSEMKPRLNLGAFPSGEAAIRYAEQYIADGQDVTPDQLREMGWRWLVPTDAPECEHLYLMNTESPALGLEVLRVINHGIGD